MPRAISTTSPSPPAVPPGQNSFQLDDGAGDAQPPPSILRLPTELLHEITRHLSAVDFLACRLSCSRFLHATESRRLFATVCHGGNGGRNNSGDSSRSGGGNYVNSNVQDDGSDGQSLASLKQQLFRQLTGGLPPLSKCQRGFGFLYRSSTHLHLHSHEPLVPPESLPTAPAVLLAEGDATFIAVAFRTVVYIFAAFSLVPAPALAPSSSRQHNHRISHPDSRRLHCLASPPTMILAHCPPGAPLSGFYASQGPPWSGGDKWQQHYVLVLLHADETALIREGAVGGTRTRDTVLRHPCRIGPTDTLPRHSLRVHAAAVDAANLCISFACAAGIAIYWIHCWADDDERGAAGRVALWKWIPHPATDPAVLSSLPPQPPGPALSLQPTILAAAAPHHPPHRSAHTVAGYAAALHHPPHQSACTVVGYTAARVYASDNHLMGAVRYCNGEIRVFDAPDSDHFDSAFLASEPTAVQLGIAVRRDPRYGHHPVVAIIAVTTDARLLIWHLTAAPLSRSAAVLLSEGNLRASSSTGCKASTLYSRLGGWCRAVAARLPPLSWDKDADEDGGGGRGGLAPVVKDGPACLAFVVKDGPKGRSGQRW